MKYKYLITLLILSISAFGQDNETDSYWKSYIDLKAESLNLEQIEVTKYLRVYRIWTTFQVVELIQVNDTVYKGQLVNYVTKLKRKKEKILFESKEISDSTVNNLLDNLSTEKIESLPDSYDIKNYPIGVDGISYIFEIQNRNNYRVYSYWEPENDNYQDKNMYEIIQVRKILDYLNTEFDLWNNFIEFRDNLPIGTYTYAGIIMNIK